MNKKKLLALLMALVMTFTLVPVTALAEGSHTVTFLLRDSVGDMTISDYNDFINNNITTYSFQTQDGVSRSGAVVLNCMTQTVADNGTATEPTGKPSYWYHSGKTFPADNNDGIPFSVEQSQVYIFDGWRLPDSDERYDFSTHVTEDITLVPHFSTVNDVYTISNEAELRAFAREVNLGRSFRSEYSGLGFPRQTVRLTADITLTSDWTPMAGKFHGIFDGDGHTISGLVINDTTAETGFFRNSGHSGNGFEVKNLTFVNPSVTSSGSYVGVLVGQADCVTITNVTVNNPTVSCTQNDGKGGNVGGLIGSLNNNVTAPEARSTISGCSVNGGTISCTGSDGRMVGGLIGQALRYLTITDCSVSDTIISGYRKIGGLIGQANEAYVTCTGVNVSGVTLESRATTSYEKDLTMGGLVGLFANPMASSYTGTVSGITMTGPASIDSGKNYIMGLVSGGTGDTVATAETKMRDAITFDVTVDGTNSCTIKSNTEYEGIVGLAPEPTYVAQIGDVSYTTVKDAITHVANGQTIEVIADSTANDILYGVTASALKDKTVTITGSKTLTSPSDGRFGFYFGDYDSGNRPSDVLNVNGITLAKDAGDYNTLFDGLTANLTDVTITGNGNTALSYANGARGTLTNVTVTNTGSHAVSWRNAALTVQGIGQGPSELTVESGTYTSDNGYAVYIFSSGGIVNIKGGTFQGKLCANIDRDSYHEDYNQSIINISGGTFTNVEYTFVCTGTGAAEYAKIDITGGTFDADPTDYVHAGYEAVDNGNGTWTVVPANTAVAQIGNKKYATLQAAFAAVQTGETIELLKDVTLSDPMDVTLDDKSVTLDLGGKTLTGRTNLKSGNLTIQNGTVAGGTKQALNVYGSDNSSAVNYSVLTLASNVTVTADEFAVCMFGKKATTNGYGAVVNTKATIHTKDNGAIFVSGNLGNNIDGDAKNVINVTGGSITSDHNCAIALNGLATVNVTGGTLTGNTAITVKRGTLNVQDGATLVANGVKVDPAAANNNGTEMTGAAISVTPTYSQYGGMAVNVSGGTITSNNNAALYVGHSYDSGKNKTVTFTHPVTLDVTGGSFNGGDGAVFVADTIDGDDDMPANFISGGIFSAKPAAAYIATGYAAMDNDDDSTKGAYPYKVDKMKVVENQNATVTVNQDSKLVTTDTGNQTAINAYTSAVSGANITTQNAVTVSGVVLTMDKTVSSNTKTGVQAVVDAARTKAVIDHNDDFTSSLDSPATVKIDVDVKVTPTKYDPTVDKVLTFDLTPYATVTVTKENEDPVSVEGVEVTNEMIDKDQPIFVKLYTGVEPKILLHICGTTTESLTKGSEATLNTFKYDDADGYCEFYVSHFSDIKAILPDSSEGGFLEIDGGSLRRRVLTDNRDSVINYATDLRLRFKINLPEGAEIVQGPDKSYFDWGLDESMSYSAPLTSTSKVYAALIINRVKAAQFDTEIYCQLHLTYRLGDQEYTMVCGPMHRSVTYIATAMADATPGSILKEWIDYGQFLLGRPGHDTYDLNSYKNNN